MKKRIISIILAVLTVFGVSAPALAAVSGQTLDAAVEQSAKYMYNTVKEPQVGAVGGEWAVMSLARSGYSVPDSYYQAYYDRVVSYVKECGGVLDNKKYTEYSRVIVALASIGKDARDVGGYDLTLPLGDYEKTIWQGMNGPIWALIALDSRDYPVPVNSGAKIQATRQMYIDRILDCRLSDGGWSLFGGTASATAADGVSDPDITGMALQALAKYQDQPAVAKAISEALDCMSKYQEADGGYSSRDTGNSESVVQMIVALCELGISLDDPRFVKNGSTMLDNLMSFRTSDGGFYHVAGGADGNSQMSAEQGLYGLVAAKRMKDGKNSLYRMSDARTVPDAPASSGGEGLPGKNKDVKKQEITAPGTDFDDVKNHANRQAIIALAARGIINGRGNGKFDPNANMTRAEFAAITVRALGLVPKANGKFRDVAASAWYAAYIGTANTYGIVNGVSADKFNPSGTITRQEAATMVARAAALCGMDTAYSTGATRDVLSQFGDYVTAASWAAPSLAFCYDKGILDDSVMNIVPKEQIKRCEIAQMLYNLLYKAQLI